MIYSQEHLNSLSKLCRYYRKLWRNLHLNTAGEYNKILQNFSILFTYNSNKIENRSTNYSEVIKVFTSSTSYKDIVKLSTTFISKAEISILEINNHKQCLNFIIESILNKVLITADFIQDVHYKLMQGCYTADAINSGEQPGYFRSTEVTIGTKIKTEYPTNIPARIDSMLKDLNAQSSFKSLQLLVTAALFHCTFESIHPFLDGNGRTGRILLNYFLMSHNCPPIIIFYEDCQEYYRALQHFTNSADVLVLVDFLVKSLVKTWDKCFA